MLAVGWLVENHSREKKKKTKICTNNTSRATIEFLRVYNIHLRIWKKKIT